MNSVTLQVPISKELRTAAQKSAADMGFSSLQEAIRIFLHELAERTVDIVFRPKEIRLSPKAEKRYLRMLKDVKQ